MRSVGEVCALLSPSSFIFLYGRRTVAHRVGELGGEPGQHDAGDHRTATARRSSLSHVAASAGRP